jgi:hypothetical protein
MLGLSKPVHIFQLGASVEEMVNMTAIAKKKSSYGSVDAVGSFNYYILIR